MAALKPVKVLEVYDWYKSSAEGIENKIFSNELAHHGVTLVSAITEYEVADLISILWPPSLLPPTGCIHLRLQANHWRVAPKTFQ